MQVTRIMPPLLRLGKREFDPKIMVDFHRKKATLKHDVRFADGIRLEEIIPGPWGHENAMVVMRDGWRHIYFLNERKDFTEDDYFNLAEKRMRELGIKNP